MPDSQYPAWRVPTPHEVFLFLMWVATGLVIAGVFPETSTINKLLAFVISSLGQTAASAARNYMPPRVQNILDERDRVTDAAMNREINK